MHSELLTLQEVAELLKLYTASGKPNTRVVKGLCSSGKLEYLPITSHHLRVPKASLNRYIEENICHNKAISLDSFKSRQNASSVSSTELALAALRLLKKESKRKGE